MKFICKQNSTHLKNIVEGGYDFTCLVMYCNFLKLIPNLKGAANVK